MHWLISQSIFLVAVEAYDASHIRDPTSDVITCGYSPMAIIFSFITILGMCVALMAVGRRRFASAMPVAGSCGMAIAAACHSVPGKRRLEEDLDASEKKLMWGVMETAEQNERAVGHCGFSSLEVGRPHPGELYM